jgi:hypothetical protein
MSRGSKATRIWSSDGRRREGEKKRMGSGGRADGTIDKIKEALRAERPFRPRPDGDGRRMSNILSSWWFRPAEGPRLSMAATMRSRSATSSWFSRSSSCHSLADAGGARLDELLNAAVLPRTPGTRHRPSAPLASRRTRRRDSVGGAWRAGPLHLRATLPPRPLHTGSC